MSVIEATTTTPTVVPDQILDPTGEPLKSDAYYGLNPCKVCGSNQHEGPEAETWYTNHEDAQHCWKCGYRPGTAVSPGVVISQPTVDTAVLLAELERSIVDKIKAHLETAGVAPAALPAPVPAEFDLEAIKAAARAEVYAELEHATVPMAADVPPPGS